MEIDWAADPLGHDYMFNMFCGLVLWQVFWGEGCADCFCVSEGPSESKDKDGGSREREMLSLFHLALWMGLSLCGERNWNSRGMTWFYGFFRLETQSGSIWTTACWSWSWREGRSPHCWHPPDGSRD